MSTHAVSRGLLTVYVTADSFEAAIDAARPMLDEHPDIDRAILDIVAEEISSGREQGGAA